MQISPHKNNRKFALLRRKAVTVTLIIALFCSAIFASYSYGQSGIGNQKYPTQYNNGGPSGAYDYLIFTFTNNTGTYYAAKDSFGRVVDAWTSTNQDTVCNSLFDTLSSGRIVLVNLRFNGSLISSIPDDVIVEEQFGSVPTVSYTNRGILRQGITQRENAIWIGQEGNSFASDITGSINKLLANDIKYAIILTAYWNATTVSAPSLNYAATESYLRSVASACKSAGIVPIAWVQGGVGWGSSEGTPDVRSDYYAAYEARLLEVASLGFSGVSDNIESYTGSQAQYVAYCNHQADTLNAAGYLSMPAVPANTGGNNYLKDLEVDRILVMFYWLSSLFENADADIYWQEQFGLGSYYTAFQNPKSPVLLGVTAWYNENPFSWQLNQITRCLNTYGSNNLLGYALYSFDGMNETNWSYWRNWQHTGYAQTMENSALTTLFVSDFEDGTWTGWSQAGTAPTNSTSIVNSGTYAGYIAAGNNPYKSLGAPVDDFRLRFYVNFGGQNPTALSFLFVQASGFATPSTLGITTSNGVTRWRWDPVDGGPTYVYETPINMNRWYCVELQLKNTGGVAKVWIDGKNIFSNANLTLGNQKQIIVFNPTIWIDDVVVTDGVYIGMKPNYGV